MIEGGAPAAVNMMRVEELNYELPEALIAQKPLSERENSRLLSLDRSRGRFEHRMVKELPGLLRPSLIILNDTKVIPRASLEKKRAAVAPSYF